MSTSGLFATAAATANAIPIADGTGHLAVGWIPDLSATYAKVGLIASSGLTMTTGSLLGRNAAGTGFIQNISIGDGLLMVGTTLEASIRLQAINDLVDASGFLHNDGLGGYSWASAGSGSVTSVALTVPSFLSVGGSPITTSGTLAITLGTQSANLVFAGPSSGGAATPTFRSLVASDLPAGTTPVSSNPSASIGLTAVNGSAATFMTSDSAPALSQAIVPSWTGLHTFLKTAISTTATDMVFLQNNTAATSGVPIQYSPALHWAGTAKRTAGSKVLEFRSYVIPVNGTTTISGSWVLESQNSAGGWINRLTYDDSGNLVVPNNVTLTSGILTANNGISTTGAVTCNQFNSPAGFNFLTLDDGSKNMLFILNNVNQFTLTSSGLANFIGGSAASAPATSLLTFGLSISVYGSNTALLGAPAAWQSIQSNGTSYKIPLYNP